MDRLWDYVLEKNINLTFNDIPLHLKCSICDDLLKNGVHSTCGCRFCSRCINMYFGDINHGKKQCPGCIKDNEEKLIEFDTDVSSDPAANKEISKIELKCPNEDCDSLVKIQDLYHHLVNCDKTKLVCMFNSIGSNCGQIFSDEFNIHFESNTLNHAKATVDFMVEIKKKQKEITNGLSGIKDEIHDGESKWINSENKFKDLEVELQNKEETITKLQNDVVMLMNRIQMLETVTEYDWTVNRISKLDIDPLQRYSSGIFKLRGYKMSMHLFRRSDMEIRICPCLEPVTKERSLSSINQNEVYVAWPMPFTVFIALVDPWEGNVKKFASCSNKHPYLMAATSTSVSKDGSKSTKTRHHKSSGNSASIPRTLIYLEEAALEIDFNKDSNYKFHDSIVIRCSLN